MTKINKMTKWQPWRRVNVVEHIISHDHACACTILRQRCVTYRVSDCYKYYWNLEKKVVYRFWRRNGLIRLCTSLRNKHRNGFLGVLTLMLTLYIFSSWSLFLTLYTFFDFVLKLGSMKRKRQQNPVVL